MTKWLQENLSWVLPMLVGVAVTFVVTRHQYGGQRSRISIAWETLALLNRHADSADLEVLHGGEPVSEPHLVTIEIRCRRPHDITKDNFHDDEPWKIVFTGAAPLSVAGDDIGASVDAQQGALLIPPRHLAAGAKHRLTVVTKGGTESLSATALVNTDSRVRYGMEQLRRPWIGPLVFVSAVAAVGLWVWVLDQLGLAVEWYLVLDIVTSLAPLLILWVVMRAILGDALWERIKKYRSE